MPASTLTAALSTRQRAFAGSTNLGVLNPPQQTAHSHTLRLPGGESVTVRPVGTSDAEMLQAYVRELSASARYNRFFGPLHELPPAELARMTRTNGPSRGTLIAEITSLRPVIISELRYAVLSNAACEFAISVADAWRRKKLGTLLIDFLQCGVRALGVESLVADVLRSNEAMLAFAHKAGFGIAARSGDPRTVRIVKNISDPRAEVSCDELFGLPKAA
jgi:GNAT superfamily N-acetyltransferase